MAKRTSKQRSSLQTSPSGGTPCRSTITCWRSSSPPRNRCAFWRRLPPRSPIVELTAKTSCTQPSHPGLENSMNKQEGLLNDYQSVARKSNQAYKL
eukprot:1175742-Prorocentrum_minimum.AAC.3